MAKVKVYTTPVCPWCNKTKEFLTDNKVEFEEVDVASDQKAAQEMFKKSGQMGVPVTEVGSEMIVGFDKPKLKKALKLSG